MSSLGNVIIFYIPTNGEDYKYSTSFQYVAPIVDENCYLDLNESDLGPVSRKKVAVLLDFVQITLTPPSP